MRTESLNGRPPLVTSQGDDHCLRGKTLIECLVGIHLNGKEKKPKERNEWGAKTRE